MKRIVLGLLTVALASRPEAVDINNNPKILPFSIPSCLSICPAQVSPLNSRAVPDSKYKILPFNLHDSICETTCFESGWVPYLVKSSSSNQFIDAKWISIPDNDEFSVLIISPEQVPQLDLEFSEIEKEVITFSSFKNSQSIELKTEKLKDKALKEEVISQIKSEDYLTEIEKLAGERPFTVSGKQYKISSRNTYSQEHIYAANYIKEYLLSTKLDEVFFQSFKYSGQDTQNIIGVKRGTSKPNEIIVIGAHMDSTSPDRNNAPGCVDNGSGSDAVMLAAKALSNITTDRTIHFILFGAEEQGLVGSRYYVNNMESNGYNVVSALIMDMIGYSNRYFGVKLETSNSVANRNLLDKMESNLKNVSPNLTYVRSYNYFGSDHVPFIDSGIPCFLAIEQDDTNYPGYHKTSDKVSYLNLNQSVEIAKAITGTLFDLAFE